MRTIPPRLALLLGAVACTNGAGPGPSPAQLSASAGDNQVGPAGSALGAPLEVTVRDAAGRPLPAVTIAWRVTGGGTVSPVTALTGPDGTARTRRTLGALAGPATATAAVSGLPPVVFHQTAQIQGATVIAPVNGTTRADSVLSVVTFSARVANQDGTPVAGVAVTWSGAAGVTLDRAVDTTDASGLTTVTVSLSRTAGAWAIAAAVPGLIGSPVGFVERATAGRPGTLTNAGGDFQVGPVRTVLPAPHRVLVRDAYGNPVPGAAVQWTVGEGGGLVNDAAAAVVTTDDVGNAVVTRTLGSLAGAQTDSATLPGVGGSPVVFSDTAGELVTVQVGNEFFAPAADTVPAGTFVRFVWVSGGTLHNVAWDPTDPMPLPPDSPNQSQLLATFTVRVPRAGTYSYHCAFHGTPGVLVAR